MNIETRIKEQVSQAIEKLYNEQVATEAIKLKQIPSHLEGDYSVITFPFAKLLKKNPNAIATELAAALAEDTAIVAEAKAIKGFCNLTIGDGYWTKFVREVLAIKKYGHQAPNDQTVVVEYSSPNTNKPLHLGHVRNNLLGYSTAEILKAAGYTVKKVQIINDRGVHICKSMLAWQKWGNGETPKSAGIKGDHLVGKYYVAFEKHFQEEYAAWQQTPKAKDLKQAWEDEDKNRKKAEKAIAKQKQKAIKKAKKEETDVPSEEELAQKYNLTNYFYKEVFKNKYFNQYSTLGQEAKTMLQQWEEGNENVKDLWQRMNNWVYDGFKRSYQQLGVNFDKLYYESETYLKGKEIVQSNLSKADSLFYQKDDGSVWIDLTDAKLDQKAVLRSDGTSMYITQDIGTATLRYEDFQMDKMVYVVANEQDYHFNVLFEILDRLGHPYAKNCHHLSYGMVNLTSGRMKSREGTVVDADDLMASLVKEVRHESESRNTLSELPTSEQQEVWEAVGLGALKFYILKVEPKKSMTFDPKQSIELQGQTGPYIQNAHVRTQSVQRMVANKKLDVVGYGQYQLEDIEREILVFVHEWPNILEKAAKTYNPAEVANYLYDLARLYHRFWNEVKILDENDLAATSFRLDMSKAVAKTLRTAGALIGMKMPHRM